jgi:hypothetical protein
VFGVCTPTDKRNFRLTASPRSKPSVLIPVTIPAPVTITSEAPLVLAEGLLAYDQVNKKMYLGLSASIELLFTTVDPEPPQG